MFRLRKIKIKGFWERGAVECDFNNDVNIIIGRNGTGKTTLMNILHSVLTCDANGLAESSFDEVFIELESNQGSKTIIVKRVQHEKREGHLEQRIDAISYMIGDDFYQASLLHTLERRHPSMVRRRIEEDFDVIRKELRNLLKISSISVYRLRHDEDYEVRDRYGTRVTSPVDYRLEEALNELAKYSAELGSKEQEISRQLQKDVLASILYSPEDKDSQVDIFGFDKKAEEKELKRAYVQLHALDSDVSKKIKYHANAIEKAITDIRESKEVVNFKPLEAYSKTKKVIELSLDANQKVLDLKRQLKLFLDKLKEFMPEKEFSIESGRLTVENSFGNIAIRKLSSGEKQLIILLIESLSQREEEHLFLADEPEISLHIEWQGKIIPAVRELNPNAQVIVATHSPEVAALYRDKIFNMSEIYSE